MKREYPDGRDGGDGGRLSGGGGGGGYGMGGGLANGKSKMMMMMEEEEEQQQDVGVDELLAVLGYKVRSSDMADVAQKLEQLEMAMVSGANALDDNAVLTHLASETVHYNPSDLSNWLGSMLSGLNAPPVPPLQAPFTHPLPPPTLHDDTLGPAESSTITTVDLPDPTRASDYDLQAIPVGRVVYGSSESADATRASDYDLQAIPVGRVVYGSSESADAASMAPATREKKRLKSSSSAPTTTRGAAPAKGAAGEPPTSAAAAAAAAAEGSSLPVVLVDSQETGIRLVHTLMACAEAVQQENLKAAEALVKQIGVLAMAQGGAMRKVATYFAEALARRIYRIHPNQDHYLVDAAFSDILQMHFYESCPYLKFAHFTANQAILEAFAGKSRVHVIDFSMKQGLQWPALMQALALRPGGPPSFRLTGIGLPQRDNPDALQQVGWKLAQLAKTIHVEFEYRGFVANSLADLESYMLELATQSSSSSSSSFAGRAARNSQNNSNNDGGGSAEEDEEAVAVNSVFELHRLLARPGAIEKLLGTVRAVRPRIVTLVEQEANHNGPVFLDRFTEALHYYSTMFDSLEGCGGGIAAPATVIGRSGMGQDQVMTEVYLGRQICNVVACEGAERTERHETTGQWRGRMEGTGFEPVHLGSNAFKQASMLLALFAGGDGYRVEEKDGCLMLGWHTRPLITTSAWRVAASPATII